MPSAFRRTCSFRRLPDVVASTEGVEWSSMDLESALEDGGAQTRQALDVVRAHRREQAPFCARGGAHLMEGRPGLSKNTVQGRPTLRRFRRWCGRAGAASRERGGGVMSDGERAALAARAAQLFRFSRTSALLACFSRAAVSAASAPLSAAAAASPHPVAMLRLAGWPGFSAWGSCCNPSTPSLVFGHHLFACVHSAPSPRGLSRVSLSFLLTAMLLRRLDSSLSTAVLCRRSSRIWIVSQGREVRRGAQGAAPAPGVGEGQARPSPPPQHQVPPPSLASPST